MIVENLVPIFQKLCSFYQEVPEEFLHKTDIVSCFYHNFFDISQPQHQKARVRKGSNGSST